jgi:hypothetical protein
VPHEVHTLTQIGWRPNIVHPAPPLPSNSPAVLLSKLDAFIDAFSSSPIIAAATATPPVKGVMKAEMYPMEHEYCDAFEGPLASPL